MGPWITFQIAGVDVLRMLPKNIDHERYRYTEYNLEDGTNTVLGYKKKLKVIEDMIHIDYITIIY